MFVFLTLPRRVSLLIEKDRIEMNRKKIQYTHLRIQKKQQQQQQ